METTSISLRLGFRNSAHCVVENIFNGKKEEYTSIFNMPIILEGGLKGGEVHRYSHLFAPVSGDNGALRPEK